MNEIILRPLDGISIGQRQSDGYVNITAFLAAVTKRIGKKKEVFAYKQTRADFLAALSKVEGMPVEVDSAEPDIPGSAEIKASALIITRKGGANLSMQGSWGHPRVAIDVAGWADAETAVLMNGWIDDWMRKGKAPGIRMPTHPEALRGWAQTLEDKQRLEAKVQKMQPHVDAQKRLEAATGSIGLRDAAKRLHLKLEDLSEHLVEWKLCYRDGSRRLRPYGKYTVARDGMKGEAAGYFDVAGFQTLTEGGISRDQTYIVITPKGLGVISRKLGRRPEQQSDLFGK